MSDDNQLEIPQSFIALYLKPGAAKPDASRESIAQRYEFCEDMATMLTQTAQDMLHGQSLSQSHVLQNICTALTVQPPDQSVVSAPEAVWVVHRLAELSGWAPPDFAMPAP